MTLNFSHFKSPHVLWFVKAAERAHLASHSNNSEINPLASRQSMSPIGGLYGRLKISSGASPAQREEHSSMGAETEGRARTERDADLGSDPEHLHPWTLAGHCGSLLTFPAMWNEGLKGQRHCCCLLGNVTRLIKSSLLHRTGVTACTYSQEAGAISGWGSCLGNHE